MSNFSKVEALIAKMAQTFDQVAERDDVNLQEAALVMKGLLEPICAAIAQSCPSQGALDRQERWISTLFQEAIYPYFAKRREELKAQGSYAFEEYSRQQLLQEITAILSNNNVRPDDGLYIIGQLVGAVTQLYRDGVRQGAIK